MKSSGSREGGPRSSRESLSKKTRVFIADDHAIVREGLKQVAASHEQIVVAGEAGTAADALDAILAGDYDVVVLDLSLPDRSGLDVLARIVKAKPRLPVLILSMEREEEFAVRALRAGAAGYLEKRSAPEQLVAAIKRLAAGKKYLSTELAERLLLEDSDPPERPHDLLSPREFEVFLMIARGNAVSRIAADLGLSVKTVNNHRSRILAKLRMKSSAELIRHALQNQLIR